MERFVDLLKAHGAEYLIDVRSIPYSKYAEAFNRECLCSALREYGIRYAFMGDRLGARLTDTALYSEDGYLDFERVRASGRFTRGISNIVTGLEKGYHVVLMCTGKGPLVGTRVLMVGGADLLHAKA